MISDILTLLAAASVEIFHQRSSVYLHLVDCLQSASRFAAHLKLPCVHSIHIVSWPDRLNCDKDLPSCGVI